ncbi:MAG: Maf family protein [Natronospirillum sp.]|uniref:Maf family protein n=1 Tax=Natronospirillum sp. TaxID=2812955 RepID=UPI0025DEA7B1|nr:nucleoside triphosphate pyrophosphatase [Natronospirillum sp.]MCH8550888.1 Maf family protein [Natronospirillum sp.]
MTLILGSASPRRKELLELLGIPFAVQAGHIDETPLAAESPAIYVDRMAIEKARHVQQLLDAPHDTWVLGADTTVVKDGQILGKPLDQADAHRMLRALSGAEHDVLTAVALCSPDGLVRHRQSATRVWFHPLSVDDIAAYWATGEPADKAGAYGIQGAGARFVQRIDGNYHAVMGLPIDLTAQLLQEAGFDLLSAGSPRNTHDNGSHKGQRLT